MNLVVIFPFSSLVNLYVNNLKCNTCSWQRVEDYENRVKSLTEQLDRQLELCREQSQRVKRYEAEAYDLDNKLRSAEGELAAGDVLRDGFKTDKERVTSPNL